MALRIFKVLGTLLLMAVVAGLALLWLYGPRFGIHLTPPSPAGYADAALRLMDNGYYATGEKWREARQKAVKATREAPDYAAALARGLVDAADATRCGWIVDLRGNTGGEMSPMLAGLSPLLGEGKLGGFIDNRGNETELALQNGEVRLGGQPTLKTEYARKLSGPAAMLQDGMTASSGEVVLLAFRGRKDVRTFGARSQGLSSANQVRRLSDGTEMLMTVSLDVDATGKVYGGVIEPQQAVDPSASPQAARSWLSSPCR